MHGTILPSLTGQAASLRDLAEAIREAHAAVVNALSGAVEHAIRCGNVLTDAKKQTGHGRWGEFLRACDLGERTAQQYMQLARLAEQNRTRGTDLSGQNRLAKSDLAGLTIKSAIRHLAPPRPERSSKPQTTPVVAPARIQPKLKTKHVDIIEAWIGASVNDRARAIDSIGLKDLLAAMPESWWPLIERRLAKRNAAPAPEAVTGSQLRIPADLSIPSFLRRSR